MSPPTTHITDPLLLSVLSAASLARQSALETLSLLSSATPPSPLALSAQQKTLKSQLATLRAQNRKALLSTRATKAQTTLLRQEIDALHLSLQNLYYEQRHLRGEIEGCETYDHAFLKLPMVSVEEFLEGHGEFAGKGEHEVTVARIEDEMRERQRLEAVRVDLERRKKGLSREVAGKRDELGRLDGEVEKWIAGEGNVRKVFEAREKEMEGM
ncbi:hypothetical protein LTR95_013490, partial [Oleoguttula sp. CCFEE 5521]